MEPGDGCTGNEQWCGDPDGSDREQADSQYERMEQVRRGRLAGDRRSAPRCRPRLGASRAAVARPDHQHDGHALASVKKGRIRSARRELHCSCQTYKEPGAVPTVGESVSRPREAARAEPANNRIPTGSVAASEEHPLSALDAVTALLGKPRVLKLPTGQTISIKSYISLLAEVADHLIRNGQITRDDCPIHIGRSKTPLIDKKRVRYRSQRELPNGFFLHSSLTACGCVETAVKLLKRFGEDPSQFRVQLS